MDLRNFEREENGQSTVYRILKKTNKMREKSLLISQTFSKQQILKVIIFSHKSQGGQDRETSMCGCLCSQTNEKSLSYIGKGLEVDLQKISEKCLKDLRAGREGDRQIYRQCTELDFGLQQ